MSSKLLLYPHGNKDGLLGPIGGPSGTPFLLRLGLDLQKAWFYCFLVGNPDEIEDPVLEKVSVGSRQIIHNGETPTCMLIVSYK